MNSTNNFTLEKNSDPSTGGTPLRWGVGPKIVVRVGRMASPLRTTFSTVGGVLPWVVTKNWFLRQKIAKKRAIAIENRLTLKGARL